MHRLSLGVLSLCAAPSAALAVCPPDLVSEAVQARLSQTAIDVLRDPLAQSLPETYDMPVMSATLVEGGIGFDPTTITMRNGVANVVLKSLDITLAQGELVIDLTADITGTADVDLVITALPNATCVASVDADAATVHARIAPRSNACVLEFPFNELTPIVDPEAVDLQVGGCSLYGDVATLAYDYMRETIVEYALEQIVTYVEEAVPAWLQTFSSQMFQDGFVAAGMRWRVMPEDVGVSPAALGLTFAGGVSAEVGRHACLPPGAKMPAVPASEGIDPPLDPAAMVSVAASRPFVARATQAAWLAGWLCFDSREYGVDVSAFTAEIIPGIDLSFAVAALSPPTVAFEPGPAGIVDISVDVLAASIYAGEGDDTALIASTTAAAMVQATVSLDPGTQAVMLEPRGMEMSEAVIDLAGSNELLITEERLQGFIENVVLPSFVGSVNAIPVTTGMLVGAPAAMALDELYLTPNHLIADLELWPVDADDDQPPFTIIHNPPALLPAEGGQLDAASLDDVTPARFLRHLVTIDGVAEEAPRAGSVILLEDLVGGVHEIEVAAVDLTGNVDPSPVSLFVTIDDVPPMLHLSQQPLGVTEDGEVLVDILPVDDRTPSGSIALRYVASVISRRDLPDRVLREGPLAAGEPLVLTDLPDGEVVRIEIFGRDLAGNEGSAQTAVAVVLAPAFGCAAAPGLWPLALLALARLLVRRRRS